MGFGDDQDIKIVVTLEGEDAVRAAKALEDAVNSAGGAAEDSTSGFSNFQASVISLDAAMRIAGQAFDAFLSIGREVFDLLGEAGELEGLRTGFENLKGGSEAAEVALEDLRQATQNLITDQDLLASSNQALLLGVDDNSGRFDDLAAAAIKLGRAMGIDAKSAVDSLVVGIGRQSRLVLDNLGIIVDTEKAYQDFADQLGVTAEALTDQQRKLAFNEAAFAAVNEKASQLADIQNTAATAVTQLTTRFENLRGEIALSLSANDNLARALENLGEAFDGVEVEELVAQLGDLIASLINIGSAVIPPVVSALFELAKGFETVAAIAGDFSTKIEVTQLELSNLLTKLGRSAAEIVQQKAFEQIGKEIADATAEMSKNAAEATDLGGVLERLTGITLNVGDATKVASDGISDVAAVSEEAKREIEKLNDQIAEFERSVRLLRGPEALTGLERQIAEIFISGMDDAGRLTKEAADALLELSKASRTSVENFDAFKKAFDQGKKSADEFRKSVKSLADEIAGDFAGDAGNIDIGISGSIGEGIGQSIGNALADALQGIITGEASGAQIGGALGRTIGGSVGGAFGESAAKSIGEAVPGALGKGLGAAAGGLIGGLGDLAGGFIGDLVGGLFDDKDTPGTIARQGIAKFFREVFDATNLRLIIEDQLVKIDGLDILGETLFGGAVGFSPDEAENLFDDFFKSLPGSVSNAFNAVGVSLAQIFEDSGVIESAEDVGGQIGAILANNIGGDLNALQQLVIATGVSFDDLADGVEQAFLKGQIGALEAQSALIGIQQISEKGIPGALGAVEQAFGNVFTAGTKGGAVLIDALQDVGAEAKELGLMTLPEVQDFLAQNGDFSAEQIQAVFTALEQNGIKTIDQLVDATVRELLPTLAQLEAQGFLKETVETTLDLLKAVDSIPDRVEKSLVFNVDTNLSQSTQQFAQQGGFRAADVDVPGTTPGPGIAGA